MPKHKDLVVVVEGVGHVVQNEYFGALRTQYEKYKSRIRVVFVEDSTYRRDAQGARNTSDKTQEFIETNLTGPYKYIDKGTDEGQRAYRRLQGSGAKKVVFIATPDSSHVYLAIGWLQHGRNCKEIYIEKPLDSSLRRARTLHYYARKHPDVAIRPIDHYLARVRPLVTERKVIAALLGMLGGGISHINIYILEDRGSDEGGPIELANRKESLKHGLILDLFPHALALVGLFGWVDSIEVRHLQVAKYLFHDARTGRSREDIERETFAHLAFNFRDYGNEEVKCTTVLGKGVGGSSTLNIYGDIKQLEVIGTNGYKFVVDLRSTGRHGTRKSRMYDNQGKLVGRGKFLIYADAYPELIKEVVESHLRKKTNTQMTFWLPIKNAKDALSCMHDLMSLVKNFADCKTGLPTYTLETKKRDDGYTYKAPTLEDILFHLDDIGTTLSLDKLEVLYDDSDSTYVESAMGFRPKLRKKG